MEILMMFLEAPHTGHYYHKMQTHRNIIIFKNHLKQILNVVEAASAEGHN